VGLVLGLAARGVDPAQALAAPPPQPVCPAIQLTFPGLSLTTQREVVAGFRAAAGTTRGGPTWLADAITAGMPQPLEWADGRAELSPTSDGTHVLEILGSKMAFGLSLPLDHVTLEINTEQRDLIERGHARSGVLLLIPTAGDWDAVTLVIRELSSR